MIDTLFLEDYDLLENVKLYESVITPPYEKLINEAITENEMLIALYENQQFLVEQDTEIFMHLRYGFVNEGVLENIGKAIMAILKRIKELISKFIGFITGNRKKDKENQQSNPENVDKLLKDVKNDIAKTEARLQARDALEEDRRKIAQSISKLNNQLEEMDNQAKYKSIGGIFPKELLEYDNDITTSSEVTDLFNAAYDALNIIKNKSSEIIAYGYENLKTFADKNHFTSISKVLSNKLRDEVSEEYMSTLMKDNRKQNHIGKFDEILVPKHVYMSEYNKFKPIFEKYSGNTPKYLKNLNDGLNNKIIPLEKEVDHINKTLEGVENYNKPIRDLLSLVSQIATILSGMYMYRIRILNAIERLHYMYDHNSKLLATDGKKAKEIKLEIEKLNKKIDEIHDQWKNMKK